MKDEGCRFEAAAAEAAACGDWQVALKGHVEGCAACREAVGVVEALRNLGEQTMARAPAPPPYQLLWWRTQAERLRRNRARHRVRLAAAQVGMVGLVLIGVVSWTGAEPWSALARDPAAALEGLGSIVGVGIPVAVPLGLVMILFVLANDLLSSSGGDRRPNGIPP